jgi:c(7)-type cytochrome triheme protein
MTKNFIRTCYFVLPLLLFLTPALSSAVPEGINLTWPGGAGGPVTFDGTVHAKRGLHCDACHTAGLFQTKKGADKMTMAAMKEGKFCGFCHNGKKAFAMSDNANCKRCHQTKK